MEEFLKLVALHFEQQVGAVGAVFMVFTVVLYLDLRALNKELRESAPERVKIDTLVIDVLNRVASKLGAN